ncbi:N-6 DNA methylase [Ligilactobacillus salitolerans]|uniref:site-specific DNA-methyltransferase (adenine-specific) n=1 Tax=Ligilactobacillus salitolerans TaxID=1808352 RepID=A0A401IR62_9LACO|nr:N-6 DNA methylase [Ligilactobacillus salitolerans]GBG94030.1 N-6 DNA methylase [Ligilactobacillus salitolerans]
MNEKINNKLWSIANKLRGSGVSPEQFLHVICMVLYVGHEDKEVLRKLMLADKEELLTAIAKVQVDQPTKIIGLADEDLLAAIPTNVLVEVYDLVKYLDPQEDAEFLEELMSQMQQNAGKRGSILDDFPQTGKLMMELAAPTPQEKIYDPYFRTGIRYSELLAANPDQQIYAQEPNQLAYVAGQVRSYLRQAGNVQVLHQDVLQEKLSPKINGVVDLTLASPPMHRRMRPEDLDKERYRFGKPSSIVDWAYVMSGLDVLNDTGRAIFNLSNSAVFRGNIDAEIREKIVSADLIEAVIALPDERKVASGVPRVLVLFRMHKTSHQGQVLMINARHLSKKKFDFSQAVHQQIKQILEQGQEKEGVSAWVNNETITKNNGILVPDQYIEQDVFKLSPDLKIRLNREKIGQVPMLELGQVAELYRGFNVTSSDEEPDGSYGLIKISDLAGGKINYAQLARTNGKANTRVENYQVQKGDVLLPIRGELRAAVVVTEAHPNVLLTQNIIGVRPIEGKLDSQWLVEYLNSPVGRALLSGISVGTMIKQIPLQQLKKLAILPNQTQAVADYREKKDGLEEQLRQIQLQMEQAKNEFYQASGIGELFEKSN